MSRHFDDALILGPLLSGTGYSGYQGYKLGKEYLTNKGVGSTGATLGGLAAGAGLGSIVPYGFYHNKSPLQSIGALSQYTVGSLGTTAAPGILAKHLRNKLKESQQKEDNTKVATEEGEYEERPSNKYKKALTYGAGALALGGALAYGSHKINQKAQVSGFAQKHLGSLGRGISDLRHGNKPRESTVESYRQKHTANEAFDTNKAGEIRQNLARVGSKEKKTARHQFYNELDKQASITSILSSLAGKSQSIKNWANSINQAVGTNHFSENVMKGNYAHALAQGLREGEFPDDVKAKVQPALHNVVRAEVIRDNSTSAANSIKGIYNSAAPLAQAKYSQIAPHLKTVAGYLNKYLTGQ